ncbi:MAG: type II toxin-antitoxin system VapB family antitoxin [Gammaproteobacteria bacterium]|nr:type II toxin-antitoxin system VapB family antitoxin [Gammaproteobacteria bacterium]
MRTNIELDPELVREAQQLGGVKTKRAVVHEALLEYVAHRKRLDLRELEGTDLLDPDYDHKALR